MRRFLRIINFTYLCIAVLLCSCGDRGGGTTVLFANDSNYHIQMIDFAYPYDDELAAGIEIFPGETVRLNSTSHFINHDTLGIYEASSNAHNLMPRGVTVIFDNQYIIRYSRDGEYKTLCELENYLPTSLSPTWWYFTYHFTDEDYEFAREHGTEMK